MLFTLYNHDRVQPVAGTVSKNLYHTWWWICDIKHCVFLTVINYWFTNYMYLWLCSFMLSQLPIIKYAIGPSTLKDDAKKSENGSFYQKVHVSGQCCDKVPKQYFCAVKS